MTNKNTTETTNWTTNSRSTWRSFWASSGLLILDVIINNKLGQCRVHFQDKTHLEPEAFDFISGQNFVRRVLSEKDKKIQESLLFDMNHEFLQKQEYSAHLVFVDK